MGDSTRSGGANTGSPAALFLRVLDEVPLVLDNLDEDTLKFTACTCWSALLATLRHGRIRDHERHLVPVLDVTLHGPLLAGLAARVGRGSQYDGLLRFLGARFPVGDATALYESARHAGIEDADMSTPESRLRALVKILGASETSGAEVLRVVGLHYEHADPKEPRHYSPLENPPEPELKSSASRRREEDLASLLCSLLRSTPVADHLERLYIDGGRAGINVQGEPDDLTFGRKMVARIMNAAECTKSLRVLKTRGVFVDDRAGHAIAGLVRCLKTATSGGLEELDFSDSSEFLKPDIVITDGFRATVKACIDCSVRRLNLSGQPSRQIIYVRTAGDAVAATLAKTGLGSLTHLRLSWTNMTDISHLATAFARPNQLAVLHLSGSNFGRSWMAAVAALVGCSSTLTDLDISRSIWIQPESAQALCDAIAANTALPLRSLNMGGNWFGNDGAAAVGQMLERNTSLATLVLRDTNIGNRGWEHIVGGLKLNSTLRRLDLTMIRWGHLRSAGVIALAEAVAKSTSLSSLAFGDGNLQDPAGVSKAIGEMLGCNSSLRVLELTLGFSDERAWRVAFRGLARNRTLRKLGIHVLGSRDSFYLRDSDEMGDEGAAALASALESNHTLRTLILPRQNIGPAGATALARALHFNKGLLDLDLDGNKIGSQGALEFARALRINRSLRHLVLTSNRIMYDGKDALARSISEHPNANAIKLEI